MSFRIKIPFLWAAAVAAASLTLACGGGAPGAPITITAAAGPNGSISPAGTVAVAPGADQVFTVTPAAGFKVGDVLVDGASAGPVAAYTFSGVRTAHTITAAFTAAAAAGAAWGDEFDGPGLDTTKWAFDLGNGPTNPGPLYGWGNGEWEYYTSAKDNVAVEDGNLVLTARRQNWGGLPFTSARLVTRGKFSFNKGRFVARIRFPEGDRIWPCFWLMGDRGETWPASGEIDVAEMFGGSVGSVAGHGDNVITSAAHWWDEGSARNGLGYGALTSPAKLSADFHLYQLDWDDTSLRASFDGIEYWSQDLSGAALAELREHNYYIIFNIAVGTPDFGMTSPDQADGPMPQKMYVDYIRVFPTAGSSIEDKVAAQPHGPFGVLPDGLPVATSLVPGTDMNLYLWNNLDTVPATPPGGLKVKTRDGSWFGFGYAATRRRNLLNYAAGYLNVSLRTTADDTFKVGISGGNDGDAWVEFRKGSDPFGFVRDGQWHRVAIPMTRLANADFTDIRQFFMAAGSEAVTPGATFEFDQITWTENAPENLVRPVGTRLGVFTERACDAGTFDASTDGALAIWNKDNGAVTAGVPFEGVSARTLTAPAAAWYGLGLAPAKLYDLSAFANGHLHLALKVAPGVTTDFKIGLKSPGGTAVRESWIPFRMGADPYGMVRDGQYHELLIPMADFCNSDCSAIAQLFMLAGDGPATLTFDDIYITAN